MTYRPGAESGYRRTPLSAARMATRTPATTQRLRKDRPDDR
jgi:hypothetical protein